MTGPGRPREIVGSKVTRSVVLDAEVEQRLIEVSRREGKSLSEKIREVLTREADLHYSNPLGLRSASSQEYDFTKLPDDKRKEVATYNYHQNKLKDVSDLHVLDQCANRGMFQNEASLNQIDYVKTGKRKARGGQIEITAYTRTHD